ncbi:hypothetical protein CH373_09920 [Leptospira perolatii]|uniref:Lipoprotein n=1 Tax=Leptospira perolatii TaxID=2023191 RepID=A0A2M9ZMQ3_9LEPT|nr:hypothetical protein [Leptospira perolatii]PJZ70096.1 hypothetical protein CH360_07665 [Leptospira perolatii]PJZ73284.1 hypothetical protein CH373_09920 [Leptospira perolatii]
MRINPFIPPLIVSLVLSCLSNQGRPGGKTPKELYDECMNTFSDENKCKELVLKTIPDADLSLLGPEPELSPEESAKVRIREELIHALLYQNKVFVKEQLGEPDEQKTVTMSNGMEEWIYRRPVSKYAEGSRPDKELKIRFQRGMVVRIVHTPPDRRR